MVDSSVTLMGAACQAAEHMGHPAGMCWASDLSLAAEGEALTWNPAGTTWLAHRPHQHLELLDLAETLVFQAYLQKHLDHHL